MSELLDCKTVWNETYRRQYVPANSGGVVSVLTALHGMDSGRISLIADLENTVMIGEASASLKIQMTPEEMELLADQLYDAADFQRDLSKKLAAHFAASEVIAEGKSIQAEAA